MILPETDGKYLRSKPSCSLTSKFKDFTKCTQKHGAGLEKQRCIRKWQKRLR